MDDTWLNCPHCGLKHRPRAQGLCPRCGRTSSASRASATSIPAIPVAPSIPVARAAPARSSVSVPRASALEHVPTVEHIPPIPLEHLPTREHLPSLESAPARERTQPEAQPQADSSNTGVLQLGGGILLLNAVLHLFEFLFLPSVSTDASLRAAQLAGTLVGVGLDLLLGVSFLRGKGQLRTLALIRLVVGMFLFGGMSLYQAQYLFTLVVVAFSCGVLVLIWGKPSAFLAGVGLTAVLLGVVVELFGFHRLAETQPLADRARIALRPDLEGRRLGEDVSIVGDRHAYKLRVPSDGWYRRKAEVARVSDSHIDLWLTQPDGNAHLSVSVRDWSDSNAADLREARDEALEGLKRQYPGFQVSETSDNGTRLEDPTIATLNGGATRSGQPFLFEVSLHKAGNTLLRVTAFAPSGSFEALHLRGATLGLRAN
ncbi:hypothetical protein JRI60_28815 [Archangium violaceum]|uniref:hypothetical protein n=1 Tax=Archangium violaceum TaxID=83451 RepID=UPI00195268F9|nr:hypothetical protein [Archangium violaceum]QRN93200.1 hypothetical protein JRI60_28815 [Archangium violaceum]